MDWVPIGAWIAAAVIAVVVLGFCAYEIRWKATRLRRDLGELAALRQQLDGVRAGVTEAQAQLAVVTASLGSR